VEPSTDAEHDQPAALRRRTVLAGAGALALAACGGGSGGSGDASSSPARKAAAPSSSGAGTSGGGGGGGPAALATLADIPVGSAVSANDADGKPILVARPKATTAVGFSAICTHMGCTVAPQGDQLACPCHGSTFEATTGQVLSGPAPSPLHPFPVHVKGGKVLPGA
jgi:cytochrome b6-f complex iron-sulfur subunit